MFTIGICDDDVNTRLYLKKYIELFFAEKEFDYDILEFSSGDGFLNWIEEKQGTIDLLFLDIEMPGYDGITVKSRIEKEDSVQRIVFATSHVENMQEAFGLKVMGFMMKPLKESDIFKRLMDSYKDYLDDGIIEIDHENFIQKSKISYIRSQGIYCDIFLINGDEVKTIRKALSAYKKLLGEPFIQIHKSYLINACDMKSILSNRITLSNQATLPIGRAYIKSFRESYRNIAIKRAKGRV